MHQFDDLICLDDENDPDYKMKTFVDDDLQLARKLQEEYDREAASCLEEDDNDNNSATASGRRNYDDAIAPLSYSELSPVDSSLEYSDPNPEIRTLFLQFNLQYFWGALDGIEVKWSPRMTLCAGLCVYEGRGGLCSVRLSQPLLKLRPRKDLVETLLHEMIHAYLFITDNDRDHDGHGPQFKKHMNRINKATGANISIYHTFHDEVESYQQHWWRCNGPCQNRRPYFGYVKRAMNRAPSFRDPWWAEHQATCGGTYTKVKEPEGYGQKKTNKKKEVDEKQRDPGKDIRSFMGKGYVLSSTSSSSKANSGGTNDTGNHVSSSTGKVFGSGSGRHIDSSGNLFNSARGETINNSVDVNKTSSIKNGIFTKKGSKTESPLFTFLNGKETNGRVNNVNNEISSTSSHTELSDDCNMNKKKMLDKPSSSNSSAWPEWDEGDDLWILDVQSGSSDINTMTTDVPSSSSSSSRTPKVTSRDVRKKVQDKNRPKKKLPVLSKKKFVSVCEGGDFPPRKATRKNEKYVFDELDNDEGLWNGCNNLQKSLKHMKTESIEEDSDSESNSMNRSKDVSSDTDGDKSKKMDPLHSAHVSNQIKNEELLSTCERLEHKNNGGGLEPKGTFQGNSVSSNHSSYTNSYSKHISSLNDLSSVEAVKRESFTGQGQKLGNGESGTTFLSHIRKTFGKPVTKSSSPKARRNESSSSSKGLSERTNIFSESDRKRKLGQAFDSDSITEQSFSKRISSEGTNTVYSGSSRLESYASSYLEDYGIESRSDSSVMNEVQCPVCTCMVSHDSINSHLDTCLAAG